MRHFQYGAQTTARLVLGCAALIASIAACGRSPGETSGAAVDPARSGTVVIAAGVDITGVNQLTGGGSRFEQDVLDQLFLSLFQEQPDYAEHPPSFKLELAQSYTWAEDGKVLRLSLHPNLEWSDGVPITAADVVWTYTAQIDPDIAWEEAHSKDAIEDVVALDDHTVEFRFSRIYSSRLSDLNEGVILPKHAWSKLPFSEWRGNGNWFLENLAVSGPFTLAKLQPQQQIVLQRNENYFRQGYPLLDRVVFRVIPNRTNRVEHLLAGQVDFVEHILPRRSPDVERSDRADLISQWHRQYTYIGWNGCRGWFEDARVRKAMTLAIDRESIVKALWSDFARPAVSPILTSVWAFNRNLVPWPYDPDEARRLLAEAGWADNDGDSYLDRGGRKFSFELATNGDNQIRADTAVLIQDQLRRVGVDAQVSLLEFNSLWTRHQNHGVDAIISAWGIDTSLDLKYAFHTDSIEDGKNYGCYSNTEVDELITLAKRQAQPEAAAPLLHRIQEILHDEQPYTFLWEPMRLYGVSKQLKNVQPNSLSAYFNLEEWWLAPATPQ